MPRPCGPRSVAHDDAVESLHGIEGQRFPAAAAAHHRQRQRRQPTLLRQRQQDIDEEQRESNKAAMVRQQRALRRRAAIWAPLSARRFLGGIELDDGTVAQSEQDVQRALANYWRGVIRKEIHPYCGPSLRGVHLFMLKAS